MNKTIIKLKLLTVCFLITGSLISQEKLTKVSQSIKVDKDVTIDLNTSYCNIEFDTWNKNTIEIEAYIEADDLSRDALQKALDNWDVDIDAETDNVKIKTKGKGRIAWAYHGDFDGDAVKAVLEELKFELADLPEMNFDFNFEMPEIPEMPEMPELPELPELPEGLNNIHFDFDAYQKDGDKYLEEYTEQFESTFGKEFAEKMEAWGDKFGKDWGEKYGKEMEEWGEKFGEKYGKKMEAWGERYAAQMERQAERTEAQAHRIEKAHEKRAKAHEKLAKEREKMHEEREKLAKHRRAEIEEMVHRESNSKVKKTIKIKMPKDAKLKVNVRHGELKFAANIDNLKADLSHTKFIAHSINGSSTSINASYSPIKVMHWNVGELNLNYVKKAQLSNVKQMVLTANSSDIEIENLLGNAIIDGSIGDLKILKIDDNFTNLNIILQNTDAVITLPKVNYNLQYKGDRTRFTHPKKIAKENTSSFSTGNLDSGKSIVVNAKYSNVVMQ
ncbi:hypothetical protein [uncultured Algibacter sp.]|uniref:hypothetical protein n=1 Tax=uncultured Algibacter sp. TaxID=298659 RepID=UPI00261FAF23|nr:hypothetical protein [uncultured Algibacter sp.]